MKFEPEPRTIVVRKENRIVKVIENELEKYLSKGYEIINKTSEETPRKSVDEPKVVEEKPERKRRSKK